MLTFVFKHAGKNRVIPATFGGGTVFIAVFVCLSAGQLEKSYGWIFTKFGKYVDYGGGNSQLNFESDIDTEYITDSPAAAVDY